MEFNNIQDICESLMERAREQNFLQHTSDEVELEANKFVESFSIEHEMHSHTISPYRWFFQSEKHIFEDGVIELKCNAHTKLRGACNFEFVDVSRAKITARKKK